MDNPHLTISLDALITECITLHYRPDIKLTEHGWDVLLWNGPAGYSEYTHFSHAATPQQALYYAMNLMAAGHTHTIEAASVPEPTSVQSILDLVLHSPNPVITRIRKWDE
jgi:hypothetical protein